MNGSCDAGRRRSKAPIIHRNRRRINRSPVGSSGKGRSGFRHCFSMDPKTRYDETIAFEVISKFCVNDLPLNLSSILLRAGGGERTEPLPFSNCQQTSRDERLFNRAIDTARLGMLGGGSFIGRDEGKMEDRKLFWNKGRYAHI